MVRIFPEKRTQYGIIVQLNVEDDINCHKIEENGFWPRGTSCKPWLSRGALDNKRKYGYSHSASRSRDSNHYMIGAVHDSASNYNMYSHLNLD